MCELSLRPNPGGVESGSYPRGRASTIYRLCGREQWKLDNENYAKHNCRTWDACLDSLVDYPGIRVDPHNTFSREDEGN